MLLLLACAEPPPPAAALVVDARPLPVEAAPTAATPPAVPAVTAAPEPPAPDPPPPVEPPAPAPRRPLASDRLPKAADLPPADGDYTALVAAIEADRRTFSEAGTHEQGRTYLLDAVTTRIFPAWKGSGWAFYGTAEKPGDGPVACGYWVASVLRDVGLRVDRNKLGKQASEKILLTYAEPERLRHFGSRPIPEVIAKVQAAGVGLWGVGLANHTGFLWNDGESVQFCHSDYHGVYGPRCEAAEHSWALQTSYTVIAPIFADDTLDAWFEGRKLPIGKFGG